MKKSLITSSLSQETRNKKRKTVNYINPDTTNAQLKVFSELTNALTTNEYITADVVKKFNVDELDEADLSGRPVPELSLNYWDYLDPIYYASISYAGDGVLDTSTGTIVGGILAVLAPDGNFSGWLTATGSESFAPAQLMFTHVTEGFIQEVSKPAPTLTLGEWNKANDVYTALITYDGDGDLSTSEGAIIGGTMLTITDADGDFSGIISATEGEIYAATSLNFSYITEESESGTGQQTQSKIKPTLRIKNWTAKPPAANAFVEYDGDGELSLSVTNAEGSTITYDNNLIVNDVGDAIAYGIIRASETDNYEAAELSFCYNAAYSAKLQPELSLGKWNVSGSTYTASLSYSGDGRLRTTNGTIKDDVLTVIDTSGTFNGVVIAAEGLNYAATSLHFYYTAASTDSGGLSAIDWQDVFTDGAVSSDLNFTDIFTDGAVSSTLNLDYVFSDSDSPDLDLENIFTDGAVSSSLNFTDIFTDGAVSSTLDLNYIFKGGDSTTVDWQNVFTDGAVSSSLNLNEIFSGAASSTWSPELISYIFD